MKYIIMLSCHVAVSLDFGLLNVGYALMSELSGAWPFSLSVTRGLPPRHFVSYSWVKVKPHLLGFTVLACRDLNRLNRNHYLVAASNLARRKRVQSLVTRMVGFMVVSAMPTKTLNYKYAKGAWVFVGTAGSPAGPRKDPFVVCCLAASWSSLLGMP